MRDDNFFRNRRSTIRLPVLPARNSGVEIDRLRTDGSFDGGQAAPSVGPQATDHAVAGWTDDRDFLVGRIQQDAFQPEFEIKIDRGFWKADRRRRNRSDRIAMADRTLLSRPKYQAGR